MVSFFIYSGFWYSIFFALSASYAVDRLAGIFMEMMKAPEVAIRRRLSSQGYVQAVTDMMDEGDAPSVDSRLLLAVSLMASMVDLMGILS